MTTSEGTLRDEIAQTRPFRSREQEALLGVLRTAALVRQRISDVLEPFGVTLQQYNVLRILRGAGENGLPTLAIGERMLEPSPGITRLLDRLEAKGLVARERCPTDRRQVLCRVRPPALELLARLDEPIEALDASVLGDLKPADLDRLIGLLDRIRESAPESS